MRLKINYCVAFSAVLSKGNQLFPTFVLEGNSEWEEEIMS